MNISILCSDPNHPIVPHLQAWIASSSQAGHCLSLVHDKKQLKGGDLLFLVSCTAIINAEERLQFRHVLVLHASNLPRGRGWSPYIWDVLNGSDTLHVCLLEAAEPVDSGAILLRTTIQLVGDELLPEIHQRLFAAELSLIQQLIDIYPTIQPQPQQGDPGPTYRRRTPEDSRIDPEKTLAEQFDLLRVVDAERYPAFFDYRGQRYYLKIEKAPQ
jgi:methionyl-tRNA formyltransferase